MSTPLAYYNEIDSKAAAWLAELIHEGLIAPGIVDTRSVEDIHPFDLRGFTQCHFFAGIGAWSYALRLAGWPDDRAVWTGSCPCQPFSAAGKRSGVTDERHLWPAWFHLIEQCRPSILFGEQVDAAIKTPWLDLVYDDLETQGYALGAISFPAASVGAPHIRQRLYFVGESNGARSLSRREARTLLGQGSSADSASGVSDLAHTDGGDSSSKRIQRGGEHGQLTQDGGFGELGNGDNTRLEGRSVPESGCAGEFTPWAPSNFVWCRDGKWRPVEPGTFPLAHGAPARVGRLRGYGNAIVAPQAAEFIRAYLDAP